MPWRQKLFQSLSLASVSSVRRRIAASQYSEANQIGVRPRLLQLRSERPLRTDKRLHMGSRSKTFTAVMALMQHYASREPMRNFHVVKPTCSPRVLGQRVRVLSTEGR